MTTTTPEQVITTAMDLAKDVAEGRVQPDAVATAATDACRELFGVVYRPDTPEDPTDPAWQLWALHVDVIRQGLHLGALSAAELSEWLALAETREGITADPEAPVSWIEQALAAGADEEEDDDA